MKLRRFDIVKQGGDRMFINADFRNRFRQAMTVQIKTQADEMGASSILWEGDTFDVMGLFGGIAEIAWSMGWRPRGLEAVLANTVRAYKIPKEEA